MASGPTNKTTKLVQEITKEWEQLTTEGLEHKHEGHGSTDNLEEKNIPCNGDHSTIDEDHMVLIKKNLDLLIPHTFFAKHNISEEDFYALLPMINIAQLAETFLKKTAASPSNSSIDIDDQEFQQLSGIYRSYNTSDEATNSSSCHNLTKTETAR